MASLTQLDNILGKNLRNLINSKEFIIYEDENDGVWVSDEFLAESNVDTYERQGRGKDGVDYREQTYKDQPWSAQFEYQELVNRWQAIIRNLDPNITESEATGRALQLIGGAIGIAEEIDVVVNQLNRDRDKYVKGLALINSSNNTFSQTAPQTGSGSTSLNGIALRGFGSNNPLYFEGWGYYGISVSAAAAPDATTTTSAGSVWLRNDTTTSVARKTVCSGGSITHSTPAADPRIDAVIAYETTSSENPVGVMAVEGAEGGAPTAPSSADIQTAVDSAAFTGARWTRLADVAIEVAGPTIETSDITMFTLSTFTYAKTPLVIPSRLKTDSFFIHDYLVYVKQAGVYKDNVSNITTENDTNLILTSATSDMIEVLYAVDPCDKWNALEVQP